MQFSQTVITGGTFTQNQQTDNNFYGARSGFQRLEEAAAPAAFHNSNERFDPPKCHPNTRVGVLETIMKWIMGCNPTTRDALITWLYGAAGAGKSAIAQTIAELCHAQEILLATFFFSRSDSRRNHERAFIATIAYQICVRLPQLRELIVATIERDPLIFTRSLSAQMTSLIVNPIETLTASEVSISPESGRLIIIIDGLDECQNHQARVQIIEILVRAIPEHKLPFVVLFSCRPEHDISTKFKSEFRTKPFPMGRIALGNQCKPDDDIRLFLRDKFTEITTTHPFKEFIPQNWPSIEVENQLVEKASGQFIYASTVITFIGSIDGIPSKRLEIILGLRPAQRNMPFAQLDALYTHIFRSLPEDDLETVLNILGINILTPDDELPLDFIQRFFFLDKGDIETSFCGIRSLAEIWTCNDWEDWTRRGNQYIRLYHASLSDFFLDQSRSKELYLDSPKKHAEFVHLCFRHLKAQRPIDYEYYAYDKEFSCLFEHLQWAPYPDVENDFLEFADFELSLRQRGDNDNRVFLTSFLPDMLLCIKQKHFRHTEVYSRVMKLIDQILIQQIPIYYSDDRLTFLVAMTGNFNLSKRFLLSPETKASLKLFQLDDTMLGLDKSALNLRWAEFDGKTEAGQYPKFICDFLNDPNRAEDYALNGQRYAVAALCCLRYLCDYKSEEPQRYTPKERRMRRQTPWTWRKQMINHGTTRMKHKKLTKIMSKKPKPQWPPDDIEAMKHILDDFDVGSLFPEHPDIQPFVWGLEALPFLLGRSDRFADLVEFANRRGFPKATLSFPGRMKKARRAITEYLARVSEE